jgi:hypothetical protein
MDLEKIDFKTARKNLKEKEGLVCMGCGQPEGWIKCISEVLKEEKIAKSNNPDELFEKIYELTTKKGRTDLLFLFKTNNPLDIGKMAIWRIKWEKHRGGRITW